MAHSKLGVVIVTHNARDCIADCLQSLGPVPPDRLRAVVVDNASTDETQTHLSSKLATTRFDLIQNPVNGGFARAVNVGLGFLLGDARLSHFWILNPDCTVRPGSSETLLRFLDLGNGKGLTGGRVAYRAPHGVIQTDGGRIDLRTGATHNLHQGLAAKTCPPPDREQIEFVSGASLVASRAFVETVGPVREEFFLYYEEVDWALRRGSFPIEHCPEFVVDHVAGASIGSGAPGRAASAFSCYFLHRSRVAFLRKLRGNPGWRGYGYGLAKAAQAVGHGHLAASEEILRGTFGVPPSRRVKRRLSAETLALIEGGARIKDHRNSTSAASLSLRNLSSGVLVSQTTR